jgi:hypothetical protein
LRTIARPLDDLRSPIAYAVTPEVATLAVRRLRRRGAAMFLLGFVLFIGFVIGASAVEAESEEVFGTARGVALTLVLSLLLMPSGGITLLRWSRRLRSIHRHGWRYGHVKITRGYVSGPWHRTNLEISRGQNVITAVTVVPVALPIPDNLVRSDVLIGGSGRWMTVVFLTGPFAVAARCTR